MPFKSVYELIKAVPFPSSAKALYRGQIRIRRAQTAYNRKDEGDSEATVHVAGLLLYQVDNIK